ncbi:MAG: sigma-70 family RNA polymerase sigma factor [Symploca sp. SIO3C6]|uniref:Sigma-70 family RNA polymerase sigma factor n=1 Tax=Symploca sp. SIO1C4 TaxID=2607765 RepID=A0A6B3N9I0_9CYAN|nr:sigma-70 family RNA polymerase sigma factor [Symploca sp. SIO3C6]NER28260.1 sigma-70 family RNA polymerase sigma factor [Symploca sp. SIO1C4]
MNSTLFITGIINNLVLEPSTRTGLVKHTDSDKANYEPKTSPSQTDVELFHALKAGKVSALGILYDRYASLVYGLAIKILANQQEAEDLTQEVFLILWRKGNYNPARGSLSSFLVTIARSRAIDRLRSHNTKLKFLQRWQKNMTDETAFPTPFEQVSVQERRVYVRQALAQLPQKQRQVLEMAYYQGCSHSEISQQLNTPLGTVKTWTRKGLLKLRQNLRDAIE